MEKWRRNCKAQDSTRNEGGLSIWTLSGSEAHGEAAVISSRPGCGLWMQQCLWLSVMGLLASPHEDSLP